MLFFGEIYQADLPCMPNSSVQGGIRPVLVVSNDVCNRYSPAITVVPLTSKSKRKEMPTHVSVRGFGLAKESQVLCEQILTLDKKNLRSKLGVIDDQAVLEQIRVALMVQLNMNSEKTTKSEKTKNEFVIKRNFTSNSLLDRLYDYSCSALENLWLVGKKVS